MTKGPLTNAGSSLKRSKAISTVQGIKPESTFYARAQQLLTGWQLEVSDVAYLQRAKSLAASGTVAGLQQAIAQAQQIPLGRALHGNGAAQQAIKRWESTGN